MVLRRGASDSAFSSSSTGSCWRTSSASWRRQARNESPASWRSGGRSCPPTLVRIAGAKRNASPRTVAAYRDTMRLLLRFAQQQTGKQPCQLDFADLDAQLIGAFLDHLEDQRGNSPRTRNARLAAIHSLYRYSALRHPEHAQTIGRVLEIPTKRYERALISFLDPQEIKHYSKRQTEAAGSAAVITRYSSS
jgi:site-specific recombinase XerD